MRKRSIFYVSKRVLLAVAASIWLIAGLNVARLGILSYEKLPQIKLIYILLSMAVFCAFGLMFVKMSVKHTRRIKRYQEEFDPARQIPVNRIFDLKSYLIMAFMMSGGIWLRSSGFAPDVFIAVFYTGLGCALALAGVLFWIMFFKPE